MTEPSVKHLATGEARSWMHRAAASWGSTTGSWCLGCWWLRLTVTPGNPAEGNSMSRSKGTDAQSPQKRGISLHPSWSHFEMFSGNCILTARSSGKWTVFDFLGSSITGLTGFDFWDASSTYTFPKAELQPQPYAHRNLLAAMETLLSEPQILAAGQAGCHWL